MRWMNPEPVIQSKVSQKEKKKYCILMYIYGTQKDGTDENYLQRISGDTDTENRLMDTVRASVGQEKGEGGMHGESNMETYATHGKQTVNGNLLYDTGNSDWGSVTRGVGGRFKREGTDVYLWLIYADVWQKPTQYCKTIILQFKN